MSYVLFCVRVYALVDSNIFPQLIFNLYINSSRINWSLKEIRRQPVSIPFARLKKVGGQREEFVFDPQNQDHVFLVPSVAIRRGMSNINIR